MNDDTRWSVISSHLFLIANMNKLARALVLVEFSGNLRRQIHTVSRVTEVQLSSQHSQLRYTDDPTVVFSKLLLSIMYIHNIQVFLAYVFDPEAPQVTSELYLLVIIIRDGHRNCRETDISQ